MKRLDVSRNIIMLSVCSVFGFSACSAAGGFNPIKPLEPGESCHQKLVGTWEGDVQHTPSTAWRGGTGRTLIFYERGGALSGVFGARSLGLLRISPEIEYSEGCRATIRFMAAPGVNSDRIELYFDYDGYLHGYFKIPSIYPIPMYLHKQK